MGQRLRCEGSVTNLLKELGLVALETITFAAFVSAWMLLYYLFDVYLTR